VVRVLVVQPSPICPPATLGEWLTSAGATLDVVAPARSPLPADGYDGYDAVVCLGGEMDVRDEADHPWLAEVRALLAGAVRGRVPVLGVCLGGQLLAAATGGAVRRAVDGPEVGTPVLRLTPAAAADPLLGGLAQRGGTIPGIQSHHDEVHELPPGAVRLASSARCPNQAFRVGDRAWGLQCHIETTPELVLEWARRDPAKTAICPPGELDPAYLAAYHLELELAWRPVAERFVRLAGSPRAAPAPDERPPGRRGA
jgi:GMP synthase-like glutamine amidotransferase